MSNSRRLLSFVIPVYNEIGNLELLYSRLKSEVIEPLSEKYDYELVFINDGSRDNSLAMLTQFAEKDKNVAIIDFSRNFGHQIAVTAGLDYCHGDAAVIMDADLQDPPKIILEMVTRWEEGYKVAYAQRRSRKDGLAKKATAYIYYAVLDHFSDVKIPRNTGDFRLIDRKVIEALKMFPEHHRYLRGMISLIGFRQIAVPFDRDKRHAGKSGYTLRKMLNLAGDGLVGFSAAPVRFVAKFGLYVSALSFFGILYSIITKLFFTPISGWAFLTIVICFIGGVQLLLLGIIGQYIARIYSEAQNRPLYIVNEMIDSKFRSDNK